MKKKKLTAAQQRAMFILNLGLIKESLKVAKKQGKMFVWGIDISLSNTGLTIYDIDSGEYISMSHKKFKGSRYQRIMQLEKSFEKHVMEYPPRLIAIEGYSYGSRQNREVIGETSYAVKRSFIYRDLPATNTPSMIIPPLSLKKFVAGKAHGVEKKDVHKIVTQDWGANTANDDESDSYVLCVIAVNILMLAKTFDSKKEYEDKMIVDLIKRNFNMGTSISKSQFEILYRVITDDGNDCQRFYN